MPIHEHFFNIIRVQILQSTGGFNSNFLFVSYLCFFPFLLLDFLLLNSSEVLPSVKAGLCGVPLSQCLTAVMAPCSDTPDQMPSEYLLGAFVFGGLDSPVHALTTTQLLKENKDCDRKVLAEINGPSVQG